VAFEGGRKVVGANTLFEAGPPFGKAVLRPFAKAEERDRLVWIALGTDGIWVKRVEALERRSYR